MISVHSRKILALVIALTLAALTAFPTYAEATPTTVFTDTRMLNLVSQGGSDNLQVKATFHITINTNREITALVDKFTFRCIG